MMTMMKRPLWACALALLIAVALFAQAPANLRGTVTDPSGANVPGASVTVTGPGGLARVVTTGNDGGYAISGLPPGTYTIRISAPGFSLFESMQIELVATRTTIADAKLTITAEKQEVTVADTAQMELDPSNNAGALVLTGSGCPRATLFSSRRDGCAAGRPASTSSRAAARSWTGRYATKSWSNRGSGSARTPMSPGSLATASGSSACRYGTGTAARTHS